MPPYMQKMLRSNMAFDARFRLLRILAACGMLLFLLVAGATAYTMYVRVFVPIGAADHLIEETSRGVPHTIQFDRLEKVSGEWRRKLSAATSTLPAIRDPFVQTVKPVEKD